MFGGHDDRFSLVQLVIYAINGDFSDTIETGHESIAAGLMGADFLILIKCEQGNAERIILCQRFTDNLSFLIRDLLLERQDFGLKFFINCFMRIPPS